MSSCASRGEVTVSNRSSTRCVKRAASGSLAWR
jgi:hypothetical protein